MTDFISSLEVLLQNLIRQLEWVMLFSVIGGGIYLCFQSRGYPLRKINKAFNLLSSKEEATLDALFGLGANDKSSFYGRRKLQNIHRGHLIDIKG